MHKQLAGIDIKGKCHILPKTERTDRETSQLTLTQKTVINQLYGANKSPVSHSGQEVTGA